MSNIQPYIILNGTDSRSISGLLISSLPPISKPQVRTQIETVDGRDGDIITPLGFSAYDKVIKIGLTYNYDVDEIIEFFNSEGIVTFSNEPDKYYRYAIYEQIDFEKLIKFKTAEVTLHVQPFKFSTTEEPELFDVVSGQAIAVTNEGNTDSRPNLTIIGSGDIDVSLNGSQILSIELEDDQAVIIDSEDMNAYAAQSAIREVVADIEPIQDLNGYDSVWIGGAGKNKLRCTASTNTQSGITFTIDEDGVVKTSGTYSTNVNLVYTEGNYFTLKAGTYIVNGCPSGGSYAKYVLRIENAQAQRLALDTGNGDTFTLTEDTPVWCRIYIYSQDGIGKTFKPMVRLDSVADSDFEPYENICEISGSTELDVTLCGKNLFKKGITNSANGVTFKVNDDGSISLSGTATNTAFFIAFENLKIPNGVYTLSGGYSPTIAIYIRGSSSGANILSSTGSSSTGNINTGIITGLIRIQSGTNTNGITLYPQLEIGSQATEFETYSGETYNIPFEQTVYGGSLNVTTGELTIDRVLSRHTWGEFTSKTVLTNYTRGQLIVTDEGTGINTNPTDICNLAPFKANYSSDDCHFYVGVGGANTVIYVFLPNNASNDTIIQVCYKLADPITIQLTPTQIYNLLGLNNMYTDNSGDLTVKHKSNGVIVTDTGDIVSFYAGLDDIEKGVLLNRAITGDYDKIRLRKGVNTFVLNGNARQFVIDKFSRWL